MKRVLGAVLGVIVLGGGATGAWFVRQAALEASAKEAEGDRAIGHPGAMVVVKGERAWKLKDPEAAGVRCEPARATSAAPEELAAGEVVLAPGRSWDVRAPFAGLVGAGPRELVPGGQVAIGERLASLAPLVSPDARFDVQLRRRTADSDRESARAELDLASKELGRAEDLARDGSVASRTLDEARSRATRARASFEEAERRAAFLQALESKASFEELEFVAPASGVIARVDAPPGARVQAGDLLFAIETHQGLRARVDLVPGLATRAKPPERATLSFPALGDATVEGQLATIDPHVRPGTLAVAAFYAIPDDPRLRPGEPVVARLETAARAPAVLLPASALLVRDGETWVYVLAGEGAYARRRVAVLGRRGDDAVVSGPVTGSEPVVVAGAAVLLAEELKPLIVVESEGGPADDKDDKTEKSEKSDKTEKSEKSEKPDKADKPEKPDKADKPEKPDKADKPEKPEKTGKARKPEKDDDDDDEKPEKRGKGAK